MKKFFLILFSIASLIQAKADEGMWLPMLLDAKYQDMVKKGLKMTPEMIYSVNHSSLKDAILQFGGGCTAEIISNEGLVLTNHHCGYASIAQVSTVTSNYLKNGFWSKNKSEEIPIPGLTVKFLVRMEDVTSQILGQIGRKERDVRDEEFDKKFQEISKKIIEEASENGDYIAEVKPLYNGNQYFLWVYQIYDDIRLVATPPENLGKFGGDTDNWMWPRHTADFSIFRIYSDKNNQPAKYSKDNKPFKPKHHLPVNIAGVKDGDFAMIMGYPGRTNRYETSYGVKTSIEYLNPTIVSLRGERLDIMKAEMIKDPQVKLQQASKYASIANYWKYFIGQTEQLEKFNVIQLKQEEENTFKSWVKNNRKKKYSTLFSNMLQTEKQYRNVIAPYYYYNEGLFTPTLVKASYGFVKLKETLIDKDSVTSEDKEKAKEVFKSTYRTAMSDYNEIIDTRTFAAMNYMAFESLDEKYKPQSLIDMVAQYGEKEEAFGEAARSLYSKTIYDDTATVIKLIDEGKLDDLFEDPMYVYAAGLKNVYENKVKTPVMDLRETKNEQARLYQEGLLEINKSANSMYPDANSTMRFTYGQVKSYIPRDAVNYSYYTTLDGLVEKYKPNDYEFDAPLAVIDMYKKDDYGRYADADGTLHTCFITTDDITGGNSGSPVMNGKGELIGLAFDGNWEAMCGDIYFDKQYKRTICVDTRFILWLIDKYGHAPNLISEMTLIEKNIVDSKNSN